MLFPCSCFWAISYFAWARDPAPSPSLLQACQHWSNAEVRLCCCKGCGNASLRALCHHATFFSCPIAPKTGEGTICLFIVSRRGRVHNRFVWSCRQTVSLHGFNLTSDACRPLSLHHHLKEEQFRNLTVVIGIYAERGLLFLDLFESFHWAMEAEYWFKVYPASARLLLPPLVQLSDVLLAFPPGSVVLASDPPHLLGSFWAFTASTLLVFHFVSPSSTRLVFRHDP